MPVYTPEEKKRRMNEFVASFSPSMSTVVYASGEGYDLDADIYVPTKKFEGKRPAVVFVHGGGFNKGDKYHFEGMASFLTQIGVVGFCISYRLADKNKFPSAIEDVKCAARYLRAHAEKYNIDVNRIGVCGSSAGGNLAGLAAYANDVFEKKGGYSDQSDEYQAAMLICGVHDYCSGIIDPNLRHEVREFMYGGTINEKPETYKKASPINYVNKNSCPSYVTHGDADPTVKIDHSNQLIEKLKANGVDYEYHIVDGGKHDAWPFGTPYYQLLLDQVRDFLIKTFKP